MDDWLSEMWQDNIIRAENFHDNDDDDDADDDAADNDRQLICRKIYLNITEQKQLRRKKIKPWVD